VIKAAGDKWYHPHHGNSDLRGCAYKVCWTLLRLDLISDRNKLFMKAMDGICISAKFETPIDMFKRLEVKI